MMILLALTLACTGVERSPDCDALEAGPAQDACLLARVDAQLTADPEAALAAARAVSDPATRDLALYKVLTEAHAFRDEEIRAICEQEVRSPAKKDDCRRYLERPHLRVEAPAQGGAPLTAGADCAKDPDADPCRYERALGLRGSPVPALREAIAAIGDDDLRSQAVAGALRQRGAPASMAELRALEELLTLTVPGRWQAEAASLLGSELPFRMLRDCRPEPDPARCEALGAEVMPFAAGVCAKAGSLSEQCFDHICMSVTEQALSANMQQGPAALAQAVKGAHAEALALEPRIEALPGCHGVWLGRKLSQRAQQDVRWAAERCGALGGELADRCYSGLAEELLTRWLRGNAVKDQAELVDKVIDDPAAFGDLPEPVPAFLPCGALSVLTGQLAPNLATPPPPALLARLAAASPRCAWGIEPP
ncbi:MAG: hypothetical protein H6739_40645 [Alphaproteobacteria bacterium]|nr:hypothetical protein [Alphaproteobacteria bacterium]